MAYYMAFPPHYPSTAQVQEAERAASASERAAFLAILESSITPSTRIALPAATASTIPLSLSFVPPQCHQFVATMPMPWRRILEKGKAKARILSFSRFFGRDSR